MNTETRNRLIRDKRVWLMFRILSQYRIRIDATYDFLCQFFHISNGTLRKILVAPEPPDEYLEYIENRDLDEKYIKNYHQKTARIAAKAIKESKV